MSQPHITLLYHYFHPDDVVSARLFSDLAVELSERGYAVTAMPSIRSCHSDATVFSRTEQWHGSTIHRVWRPGWKQATNKGRVGNAAFMLAGWTWRAFWSRRHRQEAIVIGTDPILSVLVAIPWRLLRPRSRIIHWCHDLYPHAAVSDGVLKSDSWITRGLNCILSVAYRRCDAIADLGPCMRKHLVAAQSRSAVRRSEDANELSFVEGAPTSDGRFATVTPWSLVEPKAVVEADHSMRLELFGNANLGMLYSGNLGRAHEFEPFLKLARGLRNESVAFCFGGRGQRMEELKATVSVDDANVRFAGFAPEVDLDRRLAAADVHLVSLRDEWTGTVVPSKFFGALAAGRPVLFAGSADAAIAKWIKQYQVGWLLTSGNVADVAISLKKLAGCPELRRDLNVHCHQVYQDVFCKHRQVSKMVQLLDGAIKTGESKDA